MPAVPSIDAFAAARGNTCWVCASPHRVQLEAAKPTHSYRYVIKPWLVEHGGMAEDEIDQRKWRQHFESHVGRP